MKTTAVYEQKLLEEMKGVPKEDYLKVIEFVHYFKKGLLTERKKVVKKKDPLLEIEDLAIETGIHDFAENLDHYLYGHPKR